MRFTQILVGLLLAAGVQAQTLEDAIRFSLFQPSSTARSTGAGGAFGGLGADLSVANTNPAGIAEFRKSEFTVSLGLPIVKATSSLGVTRSEESSTHFGLDNLAAVFFYDPPSFNTKSFNLAIGINKIADFHQTTYFEGVTPGTIIERFLEQATGLTPDELDFFEGGPAFDAGAIYNFDGGTQYLSDFVTFNEQVFRSQFTERSGSIQELFFTIASNLKNKVSLGFTLGLPIVNFEENKTYQERDDLFEVEFFDELFFDELQSTSGIGINLKAGFIYKLTPKFRIGGAFHSPTWYFLKDQYSTSMEYYLTNNDGQPEDFEGLSPLNELDFRFSTPWKALVGLGYIYDLGDIKGFFSAEASYTRYTLGRFNLTADSSDPFSQFIEDDLNNFIQSDFGSSVDIRAGSELAYKKFRVRVGAALLNGVFDDTDRMNVNPQYSLGIGFRGDRQYVDFSYTIGSYSRMISPYLLLDPSREQSVTQSYDFQRASLTFGFKF